MRWCLFELVQADHAERLLLIVDDGEDELVVIVLQTVEPLLVLAGGDFVVGVHPAADVGFVADLADCLLGCWVELG